jgi:hypothetical protein
LEEQALLETGEMSADCPPPPQESEVTLPEQSDAATELKHDLEVIASGTREIETLQDESQPESLMTDPEIVDTDVSTEGSLAPNSSLPILPCGTGGTC